MKKVTFLSTLTKFHVMCAHILRDMQENVIIYFRIPSVLGHFSRQNLNAYARAHKSNAHIESNEIILLIAKR